MLHARIVFLAICIWRSLVVIVPWACGCSPSAWGRIIAGPWNHAISADLNWWSSVNCSQPIPAPGGSPWYFCFLIYLVRSYILFFVLPKRGAWFRSFLLLVSRGVSIFPFCCLVFLCLLVLLIMAALFDSWLSYCCVSVCRVHIVFRICRSYNSSLL